MTLSSRERLKRLYDQFNGNDHVLIAINADPDAISSAMAVKRLLWRKVAEITVAHVNVIKRPDNPVMVRLLGVPLVHMNTIDLHRYTRVILVDSQPNHHQGFSNLEPVVIIDHHPVTDAVAPYHDIRPNYGATATILTEYLRAAKIRPSAKLATGLFYGIKTDTDNFQRQVLIEDLRAFQFLFRYTNPQLVRKIEYAEIRRDFLKYYRSALDDIRIRKGRAIVHLGSVVSPDVCVLIADFFMRVDRVEYSIVSGVNAGVLVVIFRNDGLRKNAGMLAKQSFGRFGNAGGHKSMARAEISVSDLPPRLDATNDKLLLKWIIHQIESGASN